MASSGYRLYVLRRKNLGFRRKWCCSFDPSKSPENIPSPINNPLHPPKSKTASDSFPNSNPPISSTKLVLGLSRCMLSPGRVSPIDSHTPLGPFPEMGPESEPESAPPPVSTPLPQTSQPSVKRSSTTVSVAAARGGGCCEKDFDLRLDLKGIDGRFLSLELESEVLRSKSVLFAEKIVEARRRSGTEGWCSIEVEDVGNLEAFRVTIELMYEKDVMRRLMKIGVSQAIDILELSSTIMFDVGIKSCLSYLEAVPWCESEEEKLKSLFTWCAFEKVVAQDLLARLNMQESVSQPLGLHIVQSVTTDGADVNAKKELKSLVKGLLSTSSVYQKDPDGMINKEDLYRICETCLHRLENCFKEAYNQVRGEEEEGARKEAKRTLIGRISEQVDNINLVIEIAIEREMGEELVGLWGNQSELLRMHEKASPMVRYEVSRITACVFMALGRGKVQCGGEERYRVIRAWFGPMLMDFGWLQRCSKGLDVRELEEAMGEALLTLPLNKQQSLFMEWFGCYSGRGTECPNLSKAFQVWWRRTFSTATAADALQGL